MFDMGWSLKEHFLNQVLVKKSRITTFLFTDEKLQYDRRTRRDSQLKTAINSLNNNNLLFDTAHLAKQIETLQASKQVAIMANNDLALHSNARKNGIKFFLQIYTEDFNQYVDNLILSLKKCKGYLSVNTHKKICSNLEIFEKTKAIVCSFDYRYKHGFTEANEENFIIDTIRFLLQDNAFPLLINSYRPKDRFMTSSSSLQIISHALSFGNLATPFQFYAAAEREIQSCKFIIHYDTRFLIVLCFIGEVLYKFEIGFDSIDQFIILDDTNECLNVYIPTKRPAYVYRLIQGSSDEEILIENLSNFEEEYMFWERASLFDLETSLHLKFEPKEKLHVIKGLKSLHGLKTLFGFVETSDRTDYRANDLRRDFRPDSFSIRYYLECFLTQCGYFLRGKLSKEFADSLNCLSEEKLRRVLEKLTFSLHNYRYLDLLRALKTIMMETYSSDVDYFAGDSKIVLIRRCTVTPSRVIFHFEEPNFSNRITRHYGADRFIRVRFREEDFKKLNMTHTFSSMKPLYKRIYDLLVKKFVLCDVNYNFLAMSSSQLRGEKKKLLVI